MRRLMLHRLAAQRGGPLLRPLRRAFSTQDDTESLFSIVSQIQQKSKEQKQRGGSASLENSQGINAEGRATGEVVNVCDSYATVNGLKDLRIGEMVQFSNGTRGWCSQLNSSQARIALLDSPESRSGQQPPITLGMNAIPTGRPVALSLAALADVTDGGLAIIDAVGRSRRPSERQGLKDGDNLAMFHADDPTTTLLAAEEVAIAASKATGILLFLHAVFHPKPYQVISMCISHFH